ncbi:Kazal-like serine protease inhibitor domain containing hypothetical protein [Phytophthora palmivora]|uniref:Kazal-like domain-containing protein n=1 Tax=Phytophthora palmivora TaxID=4796 RepID=A0A2P4YE76_9STRA|nr:Kazal-like serine protease inhibitor domain containing hypothetical protein [Phytophthora palmivora]
MKTVTLLVFAAAVAFTHASYVIYPSTSGSSSTNCSYACTEEYAPVCGSDGVTYGNVCALTLADCESDELITQVSEGECPTYGSSSDGSAGCADACPKIYKPVCGSDGQTYGNDCLLGIAQCKSGGAITKVYDGECPDTSSSGSYTNCPDVCIEIYKPVCGSDGVTYDNSCLLAIASCKDPSITQASDGACPSSGGSYYTSKPSYGSSGDNDSSYSSSCPSICPAIYAPVCGSDGVTYENECKLLVASCKHPELYITKVSDSACSIDCKTGY